MSRDNKDKASTWTNSIEEQDEVARRFAELKRGETVEALAAEFGLSRTNLYHVLKAVERRRQEVAA